MGALRSKRAPEQETAPVAGGAGYGARVAIVGGGASGTLLALALARHRPDLSVTLIEPSRPGAGRAYASPRPEHRLNVLPLRLSAFSDEPEDFAGWLVARGEIASTDQKSFVRRALLADYLGERLAAAGRSVTVRRTSASAIDPTGGIARIRLGSGETIDADIAILATGHSWSAPRDEDHAVPADAPVTILGTGLSMVDRWLSLRQAGHRGIITAVSRHGLAPLSHGSCPTPPALPAVPLGRPVSQTMRWLREVAALATDWRAAIDAIRPHTQAIWQSWPAAERPRFLRHARRYWDIHRHRIAPDIGDRLAGEIATGTLRIVRSRQAAAEGPIFDCRGHLPDWSALASPLIARLAAQGIIRPDPLRIGLDVTADCNLIGRDGTVWPHLFAIGPLTRGRFWEIEAIPDIRRQCEDLSRRLPANKAARTP